MSKKMTRIATILALSMIAPVILMSQGQLAYLVVSGHPGNVPVTQVNGKSYVEIEALARLANGTLSFNGNQVKLTLPPGGENTAVTAEANAAAKTGFSREFLRAGIESLSTIREWHIALASAIENQFPVGQAWLTPYQSLATTNLRLAQVSATTDSDRNAAQLIANVYQKMKQLSDKYVAQRADLSYIAPDSLKNDPLDQSITACGRSLGAMAAEGQFVDDGNCH
ncbi:MAG TPA: hypothetical protein VKH15_04225 [Candidatus Acidoferrum sp.]|nr:hypothetical protein [Candidatus Acidoferrum sp.]